MKQDLTVMVDGKAIPARPGDTVLNVLFSADKLLLSYSHRRKEPRGCLCGMGVCYECRVTIDGQSGQRACMTLVRDGMEVMTHEF